MTPCIQPSKLRHESRHRPAEIRPGKFRGRGAPHHRKGARRLPGGRRTSGDPGGERARSGPVGGLGQSALIVGALLVARFRKLTEPRWLGLVMAFGAGALISAITTDLVVEAYHEAGRGATGLGLLIGAVGYYVLTEWLDRRAEREDPEEPVEDAADDRPGAQPAAADAASGSQPHRRDGARRDSRVGGDRAHAPRWRQRLGGTWWARCSSRTSRRRSAWPRRSWPGSIPLSRVLLRFGASSLLSFKLNVKSAPPVSRRSSKLTFGGLGRAPPVGPKEKREIIPCGFACGYHWPALKPTAGRSTLSKSAWPP